MRTKRTMWGFFGALALAMGPAAMAVTLDATDVGVYDDIGNFGGNSLTVGWDAPAFFGSGTESRHFTVFDLSGVSDPITAAVLRLKEPAGGYDSVDSSEDLTVFDVSTAIATLTGGTGGVGVFNDLGAGSSYGSVAIDATNDDSWISITLNAAALADLNAATGSFAFGGAVTSLTKSNSTGQDELMFFDAGGTPAPQLVLTTTPSGGGGGSVPEPAVVALMLAGLLGWSGSRRVRG